MNKIQILYLSCAILLLITGVRKFLVDDESVIKRELIQRSVSEIHKVKNVTCSDGGRITALLNIWLYTDISISTPIAEDSVCNNFVTILKKNKVANITFDKQSRMIYSLSSKESDLINLDDRVTEIAKKKARYSYIYFVFSFVLFLQYIRNK